MARTIRPRLEALEVRDCPTVTVTALGGGTALRIYGDSDWDLVNIVQNDATDTLTVTSSVLAQPGEVVTQIVNIQTFQSTKVTRIFVDLKGGNNVFFYGPEAGTDLTHYLDLYVFTGAGDDSVSINLANTLISQNGSTTGNAPSPNVGDPQVPTRAGYQAGATFSSTVDKHFSLVLDSGAGDDHVSIDLGHIADRGTASVKASLGAGDDTLWLTDLCCVNKDASLSLDLDGGAGKDALYVMLYGRIDGQAVVNVRGGQGDDFVQVDGTGTVNGDLTIQARGCDGNDTMTVTAVSNPSSVGRVCAQLYGGAGNDQLMLNSGRAGDPGASLVNCLLDGGAGIDSAKVTRRTRYTSIEQMGSF